MFIIEDMSFKSMLRASFTVGSLELEAEIIGGDKEGAVLGLRGQRIRANGVEVNDGFECRDGLHERRYLDGYGSRNGGE